MAATRVTMIGPGWDAPVSLPSGIPIVLVLPSVLEQLPVRWVDDRPVEWTLSRTEGGPINLSGTPESNGIRSGAVLRLTGRPAEELVFDGVPASRPAAKGTATAFETPRPVAVPPIGRGRRVVTIGLAAAALVAGALVAIDRGRGSPQAAAGPQAPVPAAAATTVQLTSPAAGAVAAGSAVTVTASVTAGPGPVDGVVLLIDGAPTGEERTTAPYTFTWNTITTPDGDHAVAVVALRGTAETQSEPLPVTVANGRRPPPAAGALSLRPGSAAPQVVDHPEGGPAEVGLQFTTDQPGAVAGVRFYRGPAAATTPGTPVISLWTASGALLATADTPYDPSPGWKEALFPIPVAVDAGVSYAVSYFNPSGLMALTPGSPTEQVDRSPLHSPAAGGALVPTAEPTYPAGSGDGTDYAVDVLFMPG